MNITKNNNKKTYDLSDFSEYCSNFHAQKDGLYYFLNNPEDFEIQNVVCPFGMKYIRLISDNFEICDDLLVNDFTEKEIEIIYYVYNNRG